MKRLRVRQRIVVALAFVALAAAMALWLGVFRQERAAAAVEPDLVVTISSDPGAGVSVASGSTIHYQIVASNLTEVNAPDVVIEVLVDGGDPNVQAISSGSCLGFGGIIDCTTAIPGNSSVTLSVDVDVTAAAGSSVYLGAYVDPPTPDHPFGNERESEFGRADFGDDEALECGLVGEDEDMSLTLDGVQLEPDNYDCTKNDVVEAAAPAATRDFDLQLGWNNFVWTGASGTDPATVLSCINGSYAIAYRFVAVGQTFQRYVPGDAALSNMTSLEKYDSLLVLVTASGVQCLGMPVDP
jgi:hypothetical protein